MKNADGRTSSQLVAQGSGARQIDFIRRPDQHALPSPACKRRSEKAKATTVVYEKDSWRHGKSSSRDSIMRGRRRMLELLIIRQGPRPQASARQAGKLPFDRIQPEQS